MHHNPIRATPRIVRSIKYEHRELSIKLLCAAISANMKIFHTGGREMAGTSSRPSGRGSDVGKIVGGVIGGLLCLMLLSAIVAVCLWFGRKKVAERQAFKGEQIAVSLLTTLLSLVSYGLTLKLEKMIPAIMGSFPL